MLKVEEVLGLLLGVGRQSARARRAHDVRQRRVVEHHYGGVARLRVRQRYELVVQVLDGEALAVAQLRMAATAGQVV